MKAPKWKHRALEFAKATFSPEIQAEISNFDDRGRYKKGTPDYPNSMMEGMIGEITLLTDLILMENSEDTVPMFPTYEVN